MKASMPLLRVWYVLLLVLSLLGNITYLHELSRREERERNPEEVLAGDGLLWICRPLWIESQFAPTHTKESL